MMRWVAEMGNLRRGFERVAASRGMAGVDGVSIAGYRRDLELNLRRLACELAEGTYVPLPLLRFLVAKSDGSPRALSVPAVRDRVAQAAVANVLEPLFEAQFEDVSFAYRKGRSVRLAALRIRELREKGYRYVLEADIDSFFDEIDQGLLMRKISSIVEDPGILRLLNRWIKAEVYDGKSLFTQLRGIPQGTVVSPMMANFFLDELDEIMLARGFQLVRYADDFVVLTRSASEAQAALELTGEVMERLNLALDDEDTRITSFELGFRYLGLTFLGDSIFAPFDRPPKERRILYMPPPLDLARYRAGRWCVEDR